MPMHDGIYVEWRDDLPERYHLLAEGPERRLLINRTWWRQAAPGERQARVVALALGTERAGTFLWASGGRFQPGRGGRWAGEMTWQWWRWLLDQAG